MMKLVVLKSIAVALSVKTNHSKITGMNLDRIDKRTKDKRG